MSSDKRVITNPVSMVKTGKAVRSIFWIIILSIIIRLTNLLWIFVIDCNSDFNCMLLEVLPIIGNVILFVLSVCFLVLLYRISSLLMDSKVTIHKK